MFFHCYIDLKKIKVIKKLRQKVFSFKTAITTTAPSLPNNVAKQLPDKVSSRLRGILPTRQGKKLLCFPTLSGTLWRQPPRTGHVVCGWPHPSGAPHFPFLMSLHCAVQQHFKQSFSKAGGCTRRVRRTSSLRPRYEQRSGTCQSTKHLDATRYLTFQICVLRLASPYTQIQIIQHQTIKHMITFLVGMQCSHDLSGQIMGQDVHQTEQNTHWGL